MQGHVRKCKRSKGLTSLTSHKRFVTRHLYGCVVEAVFRGQIRIYSMACRDEILLEHLHNSPVEQLLLLTTALLRKYLSTNPSCEKFPTTLLITTTKINTTTLTMPTMLEQKESERTAQYLAAMMDMLKFKEGLIRLNRLITNHKVRVDTRRRRANEREFLELMERTWNTAHDRIIETVDKVRTIFIQTIELDSDKPSVGAVRTFFSPYVDVKNEVRELAAEVQDSLHRLELEVYRDFAQIVRDRNNMEADTDEEDASDDDENESDGDENESDGDEESESDGDDFDVEG
jgi:hypothetical protein